MGAHQPFIELQNSPLNSVHTRYLFNYDVLTWNISKACRGECLCNAVPFIIGLNRRYFIAIFYSSTLLGRYGKIRDDWDWTQYIIA